MVSFVPPPPRLWHTPPPPPAVRALQSNWLAGPCYSGSLVGCWSLGLLGGGGGKEGNELHTNALSVGLVPPSLPFWCVRCGASLLVVQRLLLGRVHLSVWQASFCCYASFFVTTDWHQGYLCYFPPPHCSMCLCCGVVWCTTTAFGAMLSGAAVCEDVVCVVAFLPGYAITPPPPPVCSATWLAGWLAAVFLGGLVVGSLVCLLPSLALWFVGSLVGCWRVHGCPRLVDYLGGVYVCVHMCCSMLCVASALGCMLCDAVAWCVCL